MVEIVIELHCKVTIYISIYKFFLPIIYKKFFFYR